jgi:hypothetical protein
VYFKNTFFKIQLLTHQYALYHHLKSARYALIQYKTISVCPSKTANHCQEEWPASAYRIFGISQTGEAIEIQNKKLPPFIQASFEGFGQNRWLTFSEGNLMATNGTFSLCIKKSDICKKIVVNKTGRVKIVYTKEKNINKIYTYE